MMSIISYKLLDLFKAGVLNCVTLWGCLALFINNFDSKAKNQEWRATSKSTLRAVIACETGNLGHPASETAQF